MTVEECARVLSQHDDYLLLTHRNPDGDTLMSAAALCRALRRKNKRAYLYPNPQVTETYLPFVEKLFAPAEFQPRFVAAVDIASETVFPEGFHGTVNLCIDHHLSNSHFAACELIDDRAASCGEVLQKIIPALTGKLTKNEATLLYIALTTDTGAFQYSNVREETFLSAAELIRAGADHQSVMLRFSFSACVNVLPTWRLKKEQKEVRFIPV